MVAQGLEEFPVVSVAILHLVDHHVLHPLLPFSPAVGEVLQDVERKELKVVEVEGEELALLEKHLHEDIVLLYFRDICIGKHVTGDVRSLGLEAAQLLHVVSHHRDLPLDIVLQKGFLHDGSHILLVEDLIVLGIADAVDFLA